MKTSWVYEFPWRITGKGWNRLLDKVAGGWSVSGYFVREAGTAMGVTGTNGRPIRLRNSALSGPISDRLGDRKDAKGNILNPYFDTTAFAPLPNQYTVTPGAAALLRVAGASLEISESLVV